MAALCSIFNSAYYANNYAGILMQAYSWKWVSEFSLSIHVNTCTCEWTCIWAVAFYQSTVQITSNVTSTRKRTLSDRHFACIFISCELKPVPATQKFTFIYYWLTQDDSHTLMSTLVLWEFFFTALLNMAYLW